jgi:hypothetical protein
MGIIFINVNRKIKNVKVLVIGDIYAFTRNTT